MPIAVSEFTGVSKQEFDSTGAFDCVLDRDTRLYIDPLLARNSKALASVGNVHEKITARFRQVITLIDHSQRHNDVFWKNAEKLLTFPERTGTCLGYSSKGTSGRGMGPKIRSKLLQTTKEIVDADIKDPEVLELIGLFEEGVGSDLVSDMITNIIWTDLVKYSQEIFKTFPAAATMPTIEVGLTDHSIALPLNPYNGKPIVLVPREILQDLPFAYSFQDISWVSEQNEAVRTVINRLVDLKRLSNHKRKLTKPEVRDLLMSDPNTLRQMVGLYKQCVGSVYDFEEDRSGEVAWVHATRQHSYPKNLQLRPDCTIDEFMGVIKMICDEFKRYIELNGAWSLLYDGNKKPKYESASQLLFYGVAHFYCAANGLDLTRESNSGRGAVDFKISHGREKR